MKIRTPDSKYPPRLRTSVHAKIMGTPKVFLHLDLEESPQGRMVPTQGPPHGAADWREATTLMVLTTGGVASLLWVLVWLLNHG